MNTCIVFLRASSESFLDLLPLTPPLRSLTAEEIDAVLTCRGGARRASRQTHSHSHTMSAMQPIEVHEASSSPAVVPLEQPPSAEQVHAMLPRPPRGPLLSWCLAASSSRAATAEFRIREHRRHSAAPGGSHAPPPAPLLTATPSRRLPSQSIALRSQRARRMRKSQRCCDRVAAPSRLRPMRVAFSAAPATFRALWGAAP
jgi:hypothetical protein